MCYNASLNINQFIYIPIEFDRNDSINILLAKWVRFFLLLLHSLHSTYYRWATNYTVSMAVYTHRKLNVHIYLIFGFEARYSYKQIDLKTRTKF